MPCTHAARGNRVSITPIPPFTKTGPAQPAFNDNTDNDPCGRRITVTANGVDFTARSLCLFHLLMADGQRLIGPPYVDAP